MKAVKGTQFPRYIGGQNINYDLCSQILLVVYNELSKQKVLYFTKVPDPKYPSAGQILKSDNPEYELMVWITEDMTLSLAVGSYMIEGKRTINQEKQGKPDLILKGVGSFIEIVESQTK